MATTYHPRPPQVIVLRPMITWRPPATTTDDLSPITDTPVSLPDINHALFSPRRTLSRSAGEHQSWGNGRKKLGTETFRSTLGVRDPDRNRATLIVTRHGSGPTARIWLTFDGGWTSTAVMDRQETTQLTTLLTTAVTA
ncbi:MAG: hypothetical protein LC799_13410 [Actinobacteria bacterium]|nr:hypothetical protein [Actinomycetota bacterium]